MAFFSQFYSLPQKSRKHYVHFYLVYMLQIRPALYQYGRLKMGNLNIRKGAIAILGVSGLALSACSSTGYDSGRYASVADYESGGQCVDTRYNNNNCAVAAPAPVMSAPMSAPVSGVVYADCSAIGNMNCGHTAAPAPVYTLSGWHNCPV